MVMVLAGVKASGPDWRTSHDERRLTLSEGPVNIVVFRDGDEDIVRRDAGISREVLHHLLVEGLFRVVRATGAHDQVHDHAIAGTFLQL